MTKKDKLLEKFLNNPLSLHFSKIEKILFELGFEKIDAKGSHIKYKHSTLGKDGDLVIPLHNNECKNFYKKKILKILIKYFF